MCTVNPSSGALTIVGVGDCEVTVTAAGTADYEVATAMFTVTVAQGAQTLSGFQYSSDTVTFGSSAPTVTAPGGAQTPLSYSATAAAVCTVNLGSGALTIVEVGDCEVTVTAVGTANYEVATAMFTVMVGPAGVLVLKVNAIATDGTVNIAEKAAGFAISGDTGSEGGVTVTVRVGVQELTAVSSAADPAIWSVDVPGNAAYIVGPSVAVRVSAAKAGYTPAASRTSTLAVDLTVPTAPTYTAPVSLQVGVAIAGMNPTVGVDIHEYGAPGLPSGLSIDAGTGVIGGTPDTANASTASVRVTVKDTAGNAATVDIAFPAVAKGAQTLSGFRYSASSVTYGDTAPTVTEPSGAQTALSYSATPATVCTVEPSSGVLTLEEVGECEVTVTAAGTGDYDEARAMTTVTVAPAGTLVLNVNVIAGDGTVNIDEKAAGFIIAGDTGAVGGVTVTVTVGTTDLTATSSNDNPAIWSVDVPGDAAYIVGSSVAVRVSAAKAGYTPAGARTSTLAVDLTGPTAPTYTAPVSLRVGAALTEMNPTGGVGIHEYGAPGLPSGLSIDAGSGVISGTPDTANASTASVRVTVKDTAGNAATVDIAFPPVGQGAQALTGFRYSATSVTFGDTAPTVTAPSGAQTALSYSATPATVCTVELTSGVLTLEEVGECEVTVTAAGTANYEVATAMFTVTVGPAGTLVLNVNAIAGDGTVNIAEKSAGFAISGHTGSEGGVTVTVRVGTTDLTATSSTDNPAIWSVDVPGNAAYIVGSSVAVRVSAAKTGYTAPDAQAFALAVDLTGPTAPTYTAPVSLQVGVAIAAMSPTGGADIDEYGAPGLPSGLSIGPNSGVISGTPDMAEADPVVVTVTVTDTAGNAATVDIAFPMVAKGEQTLTGFRYSSNAVTLLDAAPTVTAPSGARTALSYSAMPATVCTVDSLTGALSLEGVGECEVTVTAAGTGDYDEARAMTTVTVAPAGTLVLNVNVIAGDGTVNIDEKAAGFIIAGNTGAVGGVNVTVRVGATDLTAISSADNPAIWSVDVPGNAAYIVGPSVAVTVSAAQTGYTAPGAQAFALAVDLTVPTAPTYTAPVSLQVGVAIAAMSPSGGVDIDEYGAPGLPSGLSIDPGSGVISGTPDMAEADPVVVTVTVTDTAGNAATVDIAFPMVAKGAQTLSGFRYSASSVTYGDTAPTVTEPSGAQTALSYSATPAAVCTVEPSSGGLTLEEVGECEVTVTAAGTGDYDEARAMTTVTVVPTGTLVLNVNAIAVDGTVNIDEKAAGFAISGNTGAVGGVTVTVTVGTTDLTATSSNDNPAIWSVDVPGDAAYIVGPSVAVTVSAAKTGYTAPGAQAFALAVDLTVPVAPTYTAPSSLRVGVALAALTPVGGLGIDEYGAPGLPSGLSIGPNSGVISGTPDMAEADPVVVTVTVTDTAGNAATVDIAFPMVAKGEQTLTGFRYSSNAVTLLDAAPTVTAPSGARTALSYSAMPATVCTVDSLTGALSLEGVGECEVTVTAAGTGDYDGATAMTTVTVVPTGTLVLNVNAIAVDGTVNIAEKAAGFAISGNTGAVGGVSVTVRVGATDLTALSTTADPATWSVDVPGNASYIAGPSVSVSVSAAKTGHTSPNAVTSTLAVDLTAPAAPTYAAPVSLQVGMALAALNPSGGLGIDGYSAAGLPSGLSIDPLSGAIDGTPDTANASTASVTVTVTDTAGNADTVTIEFPAVAAGDRTLTGFRYSAASVTFGSDAPTVTAPGGAQTAVSYTAAPSTVCTVDASTGALTLVGVGECVVTATAAGTANYNQATAMYTVTVQTAEDNAPVTADDTATVAAGGSVRIDVTGNDTDANDTIPDDVTVSVVSAPSNGSATVNADKSITYAHNGGTATADSFTYKLNDGASDSNIATVSINVIAVNKAPMAMNHSATTLIDTPLTVDLLPLASDPDGDELFYEVQSAVHGTVSLTEATVTYTPAADFAGVDRFDYVVSDGRGGVAVGTVEVWVAVIEMARQRVVPVTIRQVAGPMAGEVSAERLIDRRGLSAPAKSALVDRVKLASKPAAPTGWVTGVAGGAPYYFSGSQETPVFEMDLGGLFNLRTLQVGGSGEGVDPGSEASSFRLKFSTDGGVTFGEQVETVETSGLLGSRHEELPFTGAVQANWVRMTVTNNAYGRGLVSVGGGDRVHLGEVAFWAGPPSVQPTQVVVPARITQKAGEGEGEAVARRLIDSSGLSALPLPHSLYDVRHTEDASSARSWRTAARNETGAYFDGDLEAPQFDLFLGRTQSLMALVVWGLAGSLDEATDFSVEFSTDGGVNFDLATEAVRTGALLGEQSEVLLFDRVHDANAVRLTITENAHGRAFPGSEGGDRVGLGEVRFLSGPHPVGTSHVLAPAGIAQTAGDAEGASDAGRLIDGSGLSAVPRVDNLIAVEHGGENTFWRSTAASGSDVYFDGTRPSPVFEVELGESHCLRGLVVWGTGVVSGDQGAEFEVAFSTDGGATYGAVERVLTTAALGAGNERLLFSEPHAANALRITVINNAYGRGLETLTGGERVALGELRCVAEL